MKTPILGSLLAVAVGLAAALAAHPGWAAPACKAAATDPAVRAAPGRWTPGTQLTAAAGTVVAFRATTAGSHRFAWSGCNAVGTADEFSFVARASCTATLSVTDACGTAHTQRFTLTVPGMRDLTSVELSRLMGAGWNLGNALEATGGETAWGNPPATPALFRAVRAAGFLSVRIPVSWKQYAQADDTISPVWMARVTQVVDQARAAGLYTIINVHWDGGWLQPTYAQQAAGNARLARFWTQIATQFRDRDDMLLFAGTNEVMVEGVYGTPSAENLAVQNGFNQVFVDTVRATGGNNLARHLVVQGYRTDIDLTASHALIPVDSATKRLMMEVHYYDPYNFTLNPNSGIWQWGAIANDPAATEPWANEAYVDAQFQKMKSRFVDQGVAVILGEYGAVLHGQPNAETFRSYWTTTVTRSAWQHGLVPMVWDNGVTGVGGMGLFHRATGLRMKPALIRAIVEAAR